MDPRHSHPFDGSRKGLCKTIVGGEICHLPEDSPVHVRADVAANEFEDQMQIEYQENFNALRANGLSGEVAHWLADLHVRCRRLEEAHWGRERGVGQ